MKFARPFCIVVLPALLLLLGSSGLGCYYETNDDLAITQLLRGASAAAPVTDLHLYFHGIALLLAWLYQVAPGWPWYGLLLYSLLYLTTVAAFAVLSKLWPQRVPTAWLPAGLTLFFLLAWLEHSLWFNYSRIPILLSGTGLLLAAQHARQKPLVALGLLMVGLAWLVRPSAAGLGLLAAAPGLWWLGGRPGLRVLGMAIALLAVSSALLSFAWTPQMAAYRTLDVLKSNCNDYQLYRPTPHTATDKLGVQAVRHWMLGDSLLVNEALFQRAMRFDARYFLQREVPGKLQTLVSLLVRDYFPVLLGQAALFWLVGWRNKQLVFWLVQLAYGALILGLGILLKLPPRLGLPLMDLWLLSNLGYVATAQQIRLPTHFLRVVAVGTALVVALYGYKTLHRVHVLRRERAAHEAYLAQVKRSVAGRFIVTTSLEAAYKSLSPFEIYSVSQQPVLSLVGWTTLDPANAALRQQLTGTRDFAVALQRLAQRPDVVWLLTPSMARFLAYYLSARTAPKPLTWHFQAGTSFSADTLLPRLYQVDVKSMK
ncbi:hypothetical protein [Hymenobacter sp. GOD-10R]|uniref:hypothetical protein n=1 Tax=Hymenobacter sp. GOD-10R TaxID=3093922 RepID=UPI002D773E3A|nr:hypothetical protein [Hymenobacter sp. GOD-10R]WRQ26465.1 hypothetical protein SD425_15395 [Hymenobacter sp. GOD-10R]